MIILCEPQCAGYEHAEVNAALVATVRLAFPDEELLFLAEKDHIRLVGERLRERSVAGVEWRAIGIPDRRSSEQGRLIGDLGLCRQVLRLAAERRADKLIFCSTTGSCLVGLKLLLGGRSGMKCVVVPHGILETIEKPPPLTPRRIIRRLLWFRNALRFRHSDVMRYLVLSPLIEDELRRELPEIGAAIRSIHLPYLYDNATQFTPHANGTIRFGSFGVGHRDKGTDLLFRLAEEVRRVDTRRKAEFILIGPIVDKAIRALPRGAVLAPSPDAPLSRAEYDKCATEVDYSVHLHKPGSYGLRTSAALFDSFYYAKPVIALRNRCFDYYFALMGDIGYLCETYEEVKDTILGILEDTPAERNAVQRQNILRGRSAFSPEAQAERIRSIFD